MAGYSKVVLVGNLGKDPETRQTDSGLTVSNFSLAVNESYGGKTSTVWVKVVAWGKTAELVGKYVARGQTILVDGRLGTKAWDKDGETREDWFVTADRVTFLSAPKETKRSAPVEKETVHIGTPPIDEDIPFDRRRDEA